RARRLAARGRAVDRRGDRRGARRRPDGPRAGAARRRPRLPARRRAGPRRRPHHGRGPAGRTRSLTRWGARCRAPHPVPGTGRSSNRFDRTGRPVPHHPRHTRDERQRRREHDPHDPHERRDARKGTSSNDDVRACAARRTRRERYSMKSTTSSRRTPRRTAVALSTTLALTAGTVGGALALPAAADTPAPDLHYTMDDVTGTTVPDASGNGLDGTIAGNASVVDVDGDAALDLAGGTGGGYVTLPRGAIDGATDLTVSARVRWDGTGGAWQRVFDLGTNTSRYLFTTPSNGDGRLRTAVTTNGGGGEALVTGHGPLEAGDWVTLTTTLDTTAGRVTTYLDGVAVGSAPTTIVARDLLTTGATTAG